MKKLYILVLVALSQFAMAQPPIIVNPTPLTVCDANIDGFEFFDLTSKNAEILGSLNPSAFSVTYHATISGAVFNTGILVSPYSNTLANSQVIHVRVQNNSVANNFARTTLQLIVNGVSINSNIQPYAIYENPFDGIATFDLTSRNEAITSNSNHEIIYFTTQSDAVNTTNPIVNPNAFTGSNLQTIWFRVTDSVTNCFTTGSYVLKVFDSSVVINIPDPKFKARLLAASPTELIAMSGPNNWITLDANNDGEIQVSEALEVTYFRLSGFYLQDYDKINSIEGINAFTNLTQLDCSFNFISELNIDSLTNLKILGCSGNPMTSLSLQNFPDLETLSCGDGPLSSLNLSAIPNLKYLTCGYSMLTSLDVTQFANLLSVDCRNAQLTSLTVNGMSNLGYINAPDNQLTTVNLQGVTNMVGLYLDNNQLTSLVLPNAPFLGELWLINNQLTTINLENTPNILILRLSGNLFTTLNIESQKTTIQEFRCDNNPNLETIFIKNGRDEFIWAANCPNLEYVCADESQIPSILLGNAGLGNTDNYVVNSYCTFLPGGNYNSIIGKIIMDVNANGCDLQDLPQPNIRIDINDGTSQGATFSSTTGGYGFYTQDGSFSVTPSIENPSWFTISPSVATIPFSDANNNAIVQDFCIAPNGFHPDLEIVISPIFPSRPGQDAVYQIVYKNKGNQTLSQVDGITLNYNQNAMELILSSETPSVNSLGQLKWSYANLLPFESRSFQVTFNINATTDANPVFGNDILQFTTSIMPTVGDETVSDNTFVYNETVVDFFVTNSITCVEGQNAATSSIGEYLHYIINFENIGTDTADNIVLRMDINEAHFDISTLQILNASHNCYPRITGNVVEFVLQNVMLDTGGHGNILLKLKTVENLQPNTAVNNQARIFYDYRAPLQTNSEQTVFADLSKNDFTKNSVIQVFPNPAENSINIKSDSTINAIEIYDAQGRIIQIILSTEITQLIDLTGYTSGIYFITIKTDKGIKTEKIIKK